MASIGESGGDSDYVELDENSTTSLANTLDLTGHISKLEEMHEVAEGEIFELARPTVIFSRIEELKIPELDDAETNPPENHQENGVILPVNTQPFPPHSSLEDVSVASAAPPPRPHVEAGNAALQAR